MTKLPYSRLTYPFWRNQGNHRHDEVELAKVYNDCNARSRADQRAPSKRA